MASTSSSDNLLKGMDVALAHLWPILDQEMQRYHCKTAGARISHAGDFIGFSLATETHTDIKKEFHEACRSILQALADRTDLGSICTCCDFHKKEVVQLQAAFRNQTPWLSSFFSVVVRSNPQLLASFLPEVPIDPTMIVARMMYLEKFVEIFTTRVWSSAEQSNFSTLLHPGLSRSIRKDAIDNRDLGRWTGYVGTYPYYSTVYTSYCQNLKPFFTDSKLLDVSRADTDSTLLSLGLPFEPGKLMIELQFKADDVFIEQRKPGQNILHSLMIPTVADAAGIWEYRPDRDDPAQSNFTMNLSDNTRGKPEWVGRSTDIGLLHDAIVWTKRTGDGWLTASNRYE